MTIRCSKYISSCFIVVFLLLGTKISLAASESGLSFSARILGGGWTGKNTTSDTEFKSTEGSQLGLNIAYQTGNFYTGINFQGGEYTFEENTPDQVTLVGSTPVSNDKIKRSEIDLVFGYFVTRYFSVFLDIKGTSSTWQSNGYKQEYDGAGLGVAGYWPINDNWTMYGSLGGISSGEVKTNGEKIGKGKSSGVDIGAFYKIDDGHRLIFGIKSSTYVYEFDSGEEQRHTIGGVYIGYNYAFPMN